MLGCKRLRVSGLMVAIISCGSSSVLGAQQLDPTRPPEQAVQAMQTQQPIQLTMIQSQVANPWALVNGQRVRVGDRVAGYQVMQVGTTTVLLHRVQAQAQSGNAEAITLTLFPAVKQPSEQGG